MKKLMTLLASAAMAFGLFATEEVSPIQTDGFEGTWEQANWVMNDTDTAAYATQAVYEAEEMYTGTKPAPFADVGEKYLELKTALDPAKSLSWTNADTAVIGEGVYFDGLVRFEACDQTNAVDLTTDNGTKLAVYTYLDEENEAEGPHVYVAAGFFDGANGLKVKYFDCGKLSTYSHNASGFDRVTIRAIEDISADTGLTNPGFVVFLNEVAVQFVNTDTAGIGTLALNSTAAAWNSKRALFPSLVQQQNVATLAKLTSVDFIGHGSIDDVVLTREAPEFAKDSFFSLTADDKVATFKYSVNGGAAVLVEGNAASIPLNGENMTVAVSDVTFVESTYEEWGATLEAGEQCTVSGMSFSIPKEATKPAGQIVSKDVAARITIGSNSYTTFADAIKAIGTSTDPVTMTLNKPVNVGKTGTSTEANFAAGTDITIDLNGQTITGVAAEFEGYVIQSSGKLTITDTSTDKKGKVVAGESYAGAVRIWSAVGSAVAAQLTIEAGTFDGAVTVHPGSADPARAAATAVIKGGKFDKASNTTSNEFTLKNSVDPNSDLSDDTNYWIVTPAKMWTVTFFDSNKETVLGTQQVKDGEKATALSPTPTKDYYNFDKWLDSTDAAFDFVNTPITADTNLYASWTATEWTITYLDPNEETLDTDTYTIENRSTKTLKKLSYTGYQDCETWFKLVEEQPVAVTDLTAETGNLTLYGDWKEAPTPAVEIVAGDQYATFAEAFAAAADGDTIKFITDFEGPFKAGAYETESNFVNGLTIDLNGKTWTMTGGSNTRVWEDSFGNSFLFKGGNLTVVKDATTKQDIAFYTYADKLEFNNVVLDFSGLEVKEASNDPRVNSVIVSQNGDVKFTGSTTVTLASGQNLVLMLDRGNEKYVPGTLTLDVNGTLPGDILLYSACKIAVGASTTLSGTVYTGAASYSGFEPAGALGSPFKAMVGAILPKTGSSTVFNKGGQLFYTLADANDAIATTTFEKNIIVLNDVTADSFAVASGTVNFEIPADVTFTGTTAFTLNSAKVKLVGTGTLVSATALDTASDFTGIPEGKKIGVTGSGPYTYTLEDAAPVIDPTHPTVTAPATCTTKEEAEAWAAANVKVKTPNDEIVSTDDYTKYFKFVATGDNAPFTVSAVLADEVVKAEDETAEVLTDVLALSAAGEINLTNAKPGLMYSLYQGNKLDNTRVATEPVQADKDGKVTLSAGKWPDAGFYQVLVTVPVVNP